MKIRIYGRVQGVGFRPTVFRIAKELGLKGFIRNNGSDVEIVVTKNGQEFIDKLKAKLPPLAEINKITTEDDDEGEHDDFIILESTNHSDRDSSVPPDVSVCDECLAEILDAGNRRHNYPFTNCTNCGARYSLIKNVPYDRSLTAMEPFKLCEKCNTEYTTPSDRRFHAQTISCPEDGPKFTLYDNNANAIETDDPIIEFARMIDSGKIGVMKSWGGMHIICKFDQIERLREWYKRPTKPFAVMVADLETAGRYGELTPKALRLLISPQRPIVLVKKNRSELVPEDMLNEISPGLGNIGLYLPYTGIQHIMFQHINSDALVMTSANPMGMPMIIDDSEAMTLGLDCYLLNERAIVNRIDDSLVIPHGDNTYFIRRARGYIPDPIAVDYGRVILSLGAERNVTASLSTRNKLYSTQYIGNSNYYNVMLYLDSAVERLTKLLDVKDLDVVAVDMHPQYPTTRKGKKLVNELGCELVEVQHHHAHAASLMQDNKLEPPFVAITIDGAGYGTDGSIWGGEVLKLLPGGEFEHVARLEQIPLLGGDAATKDISRLRFAVVQKTGVHSIDIYDKATKDTFLKLMDSSPVCSSMGRALDALSNILGICEVRHYDGEPAMRLEPYLTTDPSILKYITAETVRVLQAPTIIETTPLFKHVLLDISSVEGDLAEKDLKVIATEFAYIITRELAECAAEAAAEEGTNKVGVTGGVAYNLPIMDMFALHLSKLGMELVTHNQIPPGDGGISIGQNIIAAEKLNS